MAEQDPSKSTERVAATAERPEPTFDLRGLEPVADLTGAPTIDLTSPPVVHAAEVVGVPVVPGPDGYVRAERVQVEEIERRDRVQRARYLAVWLIALLNIADIVTTYTAISLGAHEGNPIVAWMISSRLVVLVKVLVCGSLIFSAILGRQRRRRVTLVGLCAAWAVVGVYVVVVLLNTVQVLSRL